MKSTENRNVDRPTGLSLADVHGTVPVPPRGPTWRKWLAVSGPALMVCVGYMDPGNWATDITAGSRYEYRLLWVLLMSNLMAVLLQSLAARLGIVRRLDLAQASRETYPRFVNYSLYGLAEIAIVATDLAEVLGSAIALQLLFGIPLLAGVIITTLDVLVLLTLTHFGIRKLEALILTLVGTIGLSFVVEIFLARPEWAALARGFAPSLPDSGALYVAIGVLGATVMPHNLYLHSALVQTRRFASGDDQVKKAIRLNTVDSAVTLNVAFFVNAAIMVMAAAVFYRAGHHDISEIQDAHRLLEPLVGAAVAPIAFAVALLASGQSSTITGTLAGQIVMEGYLNVRIRPWLRRLLTRLLAVVPAVLTLVYFGESSTGDLLVLSQVILSLQLPFATIPLIHFVADRRKMGDYAIRSWILPAAALSAFIIVALNVRLVVQVVSGWLGGMSGSPWPVWIGIAVLGTSVAVLLGWVTLQPVLDRVSLRRPSRGAVGVHRDVGPLSLRMERIEPVRRVGIALDFSGREERLIQEAIRHLSPNRPLLYLFHVVESPSARVFGSEAADRETRGDTERLESYAVALRELGFRVETALGAGDPARALAGLVVEHGIELVILGGHGHRGFSDMIHGTTADALRHKTKASVLVIPLIEPSSG